MVFVKTPTELDDQIRILMSEALDDRDAAGGRKAPSEERLRDYAAGRRERDALDPVFMRNLVVPGLGGRRIFRILMTNACRYSCDYCPMRAQRDLPRHALAPERLARIFLSAYRKGWCDGLFVTSGIPKSPVWAMEKLLELVETLRTKMGYRGYVHVKAMAGAEPGQIERLVRLVDRVSYNLEAACARTLEEHAPEKSLEKGIEALETAKRAAFAARDGIGTTAGRPRSGGRAESRVGGMRAGATAQFVVGLGGETDRELLGFAEGLEKRGLIHHPHFAAFRPIRGTPLEGKAETPAIREHRLYQADHLMRDYGFRAEELVFDGDGKLPLDRDPKFQWALAHPELFPVELKTATREALRRVPGFGPRSVERFLAARGAETITGLLDLKRYGVVTSRAGGFVTWGGRTLGAKRLQPSLFDAASLSAGVTYDVSPGTFR